MRQMRLRWAAGVALVAACAAPGAAPAAPAEEFLARLKSPVPAERAAAARGLGESGAMAHSAPLAGLLKDADPSVREAAHDALWSIWMRSGDPEVDALMRRGVMWLEQGLPEKAVGTFSEMVALKPAFAEGWNKRATALYMAKRFKESIADCEKTLALNPLHFGALFGLGLNYIGLRDWEGAISAFRRTLGVIPHSEAAVRYIEALERLLAESRKPL
jgi:tetratricopeptide (TPR) repeat protein